MMAQQQCSSFTLSGPQNCYKLEEGIQKNYGTNGIIYWTQQPGSPMKTFYDVNTKMPVEINDPRILSEFPLLVTEIQQMSMQRSSTSPSFGSDYTVMENMGMGNMGMGNQSLVPYGSTYGSKTFPSNTFPRTFSRGGKMSKKMKMKAQKGGADESGVMPHCAKVWDQQGKYPYALEPNMMGGSVTPNSSAFGSSAASVQSAGARRAVRRGRTRTQKRSRGQRRGRSQKQQRSQRRSRGQRNSQRRQRR